MAVSATAIGGLGSSCDAEREVVMFTDPYTLFDLSVIVGAAVFLVWNLSPRQRARRRRQAARDRIVVRRLLAERPANDHAEVSDDR